MTKEQAIERCHQLLKTKHSSWLGLSNQQAIAILIDMLKEKDTEIEKKDKQIDLMTDFMYKAGTGRRVLSCMFRQNDECNENGCRYCIKQYFENKAKE